MPALLVAAFSACVDGPDVLDPLVPPEPPASAALVAAAWVVDVDRAAGTVRIRGAARTLESSSALLADYFGLKPGAGDLSILAGDVVDVVADPESLSFSAVGAFSPGLVRVTFDAAIRNKLSAVNLLTPTFPLPPEGVRGILVMPVETEAIESAGSVGSSGGGIVVQLPSEGLVAPSVDFDGGPHDFFNDDGCPPGSNDCYRYELYPQPLLGGRSSPFRTVGFDIEPTVARFRARLLVAGDATDVPVNAWGVWTDVAGTEIASGTVGDTVELQLCAVFPQNAGPGMRAWVTQFPVATPLTVEDFDAFVGGVGRCASAVPGAPGPTDVFASGFIDDGVVLLKTLENAFTAGVYSVGRLRVRLDGAATLRPAATGDWAAAPFGVGSGDFVFDIADLEVVSPPSGNLAPLAAPGSPITADVGATVRLDGSASGDPDGAIVAYAWTFDDGTPSRSGSTTDYDCAAEGTTLVELVVTDDQGATGRALTTVHCEPPGVVTVYGVWTDSADRPISSATVGQAVRLQICVTERARVSAFQARFDPVQPADLVSAVDLGAEARGAGACANPGGRDVMNAFTSNIIPVGMVRMVNVSLSSAPGIGRQGLAVVELVPLAAGLLPATLQVDVLDDYDSLSVLGQVVVELPPLPIS